VQAKEVKATMSRLPVSQKIVDISNIRFLVADDSGFMRRLVISALKGFGARTILEASTARQSYDLICQRTADIALLDWEFGDGTGEAIMRKVRTPDHPAAFQTVIMMSGHDEKCRIERALRFGVNGYVAKPVAPATLYAQICQAILHPRPYLRTQTYFGPQHPLIMQDLAAAGLAEGASFAERSSQPYTPPATHGGSANDFFNLDEIDVMD
jgi:two-component system, chemotaxis family, chemotaxis protein CheY